MPSCRSTSVYYLGLGKTVQSCPDDSFNSFRLLLVTQQNESTFVITLPVFQSLDYLGRLHRLPQLL